MNRIKNKFIVTMLILTTITVVLSPAINARFSTASSDLTISNDSKLSDNAPSEDTISDNNNKISDNTGSGNDNQISDDTLSGSAEEIDQATDELMGSVEDELEIKAKIGTFWWYRGNGGLIYAEGDAEGFGSTLAGDGCAWSINKNSEDNELYDDYIQDGANELIDNVDIAYLVGHSGQTVFGIYRPFPNIINPFFDYPEYAEAYRCRWGDDGQNKWVVIPACESAKGGIWKLKGLLGFQYALKGTNMILGYDTLCSDAEYGPTFANKIIEGMTLKEAWFATADECEHVHARVKILGEDESVGNDYLKGYGNYSNPKVDLWYTWWTHEVNGWEKNYNWVAPDNNNTLWENGPLSYDNHDQDYITDPNYESNTYSTFGLDVNGSSGWSAPLILTLNEPTTIRGFRIIANKYVTNNNVNHVEEPIFDEMKLSFYEIGNNQPVTTVILSNWESGFWRIIDFEEGSTYQTQATISGDRMPTVISVKIEIHENSGDYSFDKYPAKISEFDFWSTSAIGISTQNMGYNIVPQEYDEELFESVASKVDMTGDVEYINSLETYKIEDCGKTLEYNTQTGILSYTNPSKTYATAFSEPTTRSDANAEDIAKDLLIECRLPANEIEKTMITYDTQGCGNKETGEILYEWITTKTVYFERQINGVKLTDNIKVTVGENGDIASFTIPMQTLEIVSQNQNAQNTQNVYTHNYSIEQFHVQPNSLISAIILRFLSLANLS